MEGKTASIQVLQASIDEEDISEYRFLVDNVYVKYVDIDHGIYSVDDMCFAPDLIPQLPAFPVGDWNVGHIARNPGTGEIYFDQTSKEHLPGIEHLWHSTRIDHLELILGEGIRSNIYEVTCAQFKTPVVAKFARFPWEILYFEAETIAYQWIDGQNIGPKFLGHLLEEGRVIGFFIEKVGNGRHAEPKDLLQCREALSKLHALGIKHGDTNKYNFLLNASGVTLIDFECASKDEALDVLSQEADGLTEQLADTSGRGGCITIVAEDSVENSNSCA